MRYFGIPFDINTEDKVIGGYLSFRQFVWLSLPVLTLIILFALNKGYLIIETGALGARIAGVIWYKIIIRLIIVLIAAVFGLIMAFAKFHGINADKNLIKKLSFKMRKKIIKYSDY